MTRALVLGGGGPVGIGWESGLAVGLREHGVDLSGADQIVGTSAGSLVGALIALGRDLEETARRLAATRRPATELGDSATPGSSMAARMEKLMAAMAAAGSSGAPPEQSRREIGRLALETEGLPEEQFVSFFDEVAGCEWPERFACTTVDAVSGEFVVWDVASGIELRRGIASSCSVPCVYPPVTIAGRRYIDGGMRSGLNADVAVGHTTVLVVSVMVLELPEGMSNPLFDRLRAQRDAEFAALSATGATTATIGPGAEFLELSGWGANLMDAGKAADAFEAGRRQGAAEAARLVEFWSV